MNKDNLSFLVESEDCLRWKNRPKSTVLVNKIVALGQCAVLAFVVGRHRRKTGKWYFLVHAEAVLLQR